MKEKPAKKTTEVRGLCASRAARHGAKSEDLALGLEYLALEILAQDPELVDSIISENNASEQNFGEWHTGGASDGGIDGILFNEELTQVTIIQAKNYSRAVDAAVIEEARAFYFRLPEWMESDFVRKLNDKTQALLSDSQLNPRNQHVDLYFVTTCTSSEANYKEVAEQASQTFQEQGLNVDCHFLTQADLLDLHETAGQSQSSKTLREVALTFSPDDFIIFDEGPSRALVGVIKGNQLAELYNRKDVKNLLFNANVRAALSTGKVNPDIRKSAVKDAANFFYYNNGVTATCDAFEVQGSNVKIKSMQVVNGAQTVAALAKELRLLKASSPVRVLIRIIETNKNSHLREAITRYQNTQNPVKASDFFSNDPFQLWLDSTIQSHSGVNGFPSVWYEHKRGLRPANTAGRRKLTMEQLALLRFAALENPTFTYKLAKNIWDGEDNNANYWIAFGREKSEITEWNKSEIAEVGWLIQDWLELRSKHADVKKAGSTNQESKYLGVLARYITAAKYRLVRELQERGELPEFDSILSNPKIYATELKRVDRVVRSAVRKEYEGWSQRVANARLNLPQDEATWVRLVDGLISQYDFDRDLSD